jgi:hypothetical protein
MFHGGPFIIADNELPPTYRGSHTEIDFDYSQPTVATMTILD